MADGGFAARVQYELAAMHQNYEQLESKLEPQYQQKIDSSVDHPLSSIDRLQCSIDQFALEMRSQSETVSLLGAKADFDEQTLQVQQYNTPQVKIAASIVACDLPEWKSDFSSKGCGGFVTVHGCRKIADGGVEDKGSIALISDEGSGYNLTEEIEKETTWLNKGLSVSENLALEDGNNDQLIMGKRIIRDTANDMTETGVKKLDLPMIVGPIEGPMTELILGLSLQPKICWTRLKVDFKEGP
ncbi:hypothetical protein COLO4_37402 [Corchorus olitorius]|uniref:Uncharacterized protein n=1 Tax=Corchorus olitorius TaxID=93759 RepID=A0A1R3G219_9ROSI|nr:hypothetical protein COLO4_37402 [Corchorus olitorius]